MVSDLLHLIFRQQLSPGATVTGLRARLALLPVLLQQFLRFLARLRSTLLTSLRHIRRRRRGTVARTRGGFLLQHPQPLLQTQLPIHQPHQELNARLPTRVIDRLSLRPLHTDKVRRPPERTLLWKARRTERLRVLGFSGGTAQRRKLRASARRPTVPIPRGHPWPAGDALSQDTPLRHKHRARSSHEPTRHKTLLTRLSRALIGADHEEPLGA